MNDLREQMCDDWKNLPSGLEAVRNNPDIPVSITAPHTSHEVVRDLTVGEILEWAKQCAHNNWLHWLPLLNSSERVRVKK